MIAAALCALMLGWWDTEWRESDPKPFELVRVIVADLGQEARNDDKPYRVSRNDVFWVIGFPAILGALVGGLAIYAVNRSIDNRGSPREPQGDDWYG